ncbi:MAG: twin-arginine translocase subunit TatC [Myxococcota bacterium]
MSQVPNQPDDEPLDEVEQYRMPLMDHLRELRNRLMYAIAAGIVGFCISMVFVDEILAFITAPLYASLAANNIEGGLSIVNSPFEGMTVWLHAAMFGALTISSPVIAYQLWAFVAPGLYQTERRMVAPLAFSSSALFIGGAAFCYYVIFPVAFPFFFQVVPASVNLSIEGYLWGILKMLVAFGVCFQLPIAVFFLARMGLVDHRDMVSAFRYSLVGIFIVAAIITPPDILSQTLLAIPLTILYIASIGVAWLFTTKVRDAT